MKILALIITLTLVAPASAVQFMYCSGNRDALWLLGTNPKKIISLCVKIKGNTLINAKDCEVDLNLQLKDAIDELKNKLQEDFRLLLSADVYSEQFSFYLSSDDYPDFNSNNHLDYTFGDFKDSVLAPPFTLYITMEKQ